MLGAAIAQVVAIHRGDHHVAQFHVMDGLRQVRRFLLVQRRRPAVTDIAKRAAPRAHVAHDHECRGAVAKTFGEIGATGFLAYGVQVLIAQHGLDFCNRIRGRRLDPDPWRLAQRRQGHFDFHGNPRHFFLGAEFLPRFEPGASFWVGLVHVVYFRFFSKYCSSSVATSSRSAGPPRSFNCVTSRSSKPQGLMRLKGSRSMSILNARPW